jgi:heavy metal sensor kinase
MRKSIRWRLQAWYALVLVAVVGGFAGILYWRLRASQIQGADAWLVAAIQVLDANLRQIPPPELMHDLPGPRPPRRRPPPEFDERAFALRREPPPPPDLETLFDRLELPEVRDPRGNVPPASTYFGIWRADGTILKSSALPSDIASRETLAEKEYLEPATYWRGDRRESVAMGPGRTRILVGRSLLPEQAQLRRLAWQLAGIAAVVLTSGLAGGWLISRRILQPVAQIARTASGISETNLSERIDGNAVDEELAELAQVLNATFARLEAAFARQARFTADASHELRTPLTILRSHAELALARPRSAAEYRHTIEACLLASQRMSALVEGLLTLARADAGKLQADCRPVDLPKIIEDTTALLAPLAQAKEVSICKTLEPASVRGDPLRLGQLVNNLIGNAIQFSRPGGQVNVQLSSLGETANISVVDNGCGIPEQDQPHIFERFYRVDKARSRSAGGMGLGLAICKSIVEAHSGSIGFESKPGQGSHFWVKLPRL